MDQGAVHFLEMTDLALGRGTNMDEQDRQDGVHVSFRSTIVGEFCATLLVEERFLPRTKKFLSCSSMFVFPPPYPFLFNELRPMDQHARKKSQNVFRFLVARGNTRSKSNEQVRSRSHQEFR
jgi:hypothetical protein